MSATFDATTRAAYEAATTATAKAAAVVSSLTGTVSVKVYNASNTAVGDGTMDSPWATSSLGTVTIGEVTEFEVTTTGTPDSGWYIRFENSDASRWVRASFGLAASSQDFKWSLATWEDGQTGTIGTATIICPGNSAPVFTVAPASASIASAGGTIQFTATDPDGGTLTYSLTTTRSGITINSTTGLVTVTAAATGTSGNIVVQASDGILTASTTCAVTVASNLALDWNQAFESASDVQSGGTPFYWSRTPYSTITSGNSEHSREGSASLKTVLPYGPSIGQAITASWRSEVTQSSRSIPLNQHVWIGYSMYLPAGHVYFDTWEVLGQLHGETNSVPYQFGDGPGGGYNDGNFAWSYCIGGTDTSVSRGRVAIASVASLAGKWTDVVMYLVLNNAGAGAHKLWINGELKLNRTGTTWITGFDGGYAGYWKMGVYNGWRDGTSSPSITSRVAWWDCYRQISESSYFDRYADVAPLGDRLSAP